MARIYAIVDQQRSFPTTSIASGKSGTGKTVKSRERAEYFLGLGFCVIYLYDWGRFEAPFMNFPNPYTWMWGLYKDRAYRHLHVDLEKDMHMRYQPRGFKTYCYVPFTDSMPTTLPACFRPFRISFDDIDFEEFCVLLGGISGANKDLLRMVWYNKPRGISFRNFVERIISYALHGKIVVKLKDEEIVSDMGTGGFTSLITSIQRLYNTGIVCDRGDFFALDLAAVMKDNKVVHSFSMAFMDDTETSYLIYAYLLRKIRDLRRKNPTHYPNLFLIINEAHELVPSQIDHAGQSQSIYYLKLLLTQPRDIKVWAYLDTQRFMRLEKTIRGGAYTYYIFKSDYIDIDELVARYRLANTIVSAIRNLEVGACCQIMDRYDVPFYYPPPLSMCKKFDDEFFDWWKRYGLPYNTFHFEKPERIFMLKQEVPKQEQKEVSKIDERLFNFHRYATMQWKSLKKPVTREDFISLSGTSDSYFDLIIVKHKLFSSLFRREIVKRKFFFVPLKVESYDALRGTTTLKD